MSNINKFFLITIIITASFSSVYAQGTAGDKAKYETRFIVDMPTAGMLPNNYYSVTGYVYPMGGIMIAADFGIWNFVNAGLSFSGNNIVGDADVTWQNLPGINIKARALDEKVYLPALTFGFSSQGSSNYMGDNRFKTHSPGFFMALSKNFLWDLGNLAFHTGLNYSLEPKPEYSSPNVYFGAEQSIGDYFAVNGEFNLQLDEQENGFYSKRGLFNLSLRGSIANGITAEIKLRDLFNHARYSEGPERIIALEVIKVLK